MWARVLSFLFCILVFQCSGGIYLASVSEMVGATALIQEDILMAGYASFIGMTMIFPILFRLKFRFPSRTILPVVAIGLIVGNIITMSTRSLPVLAVTCFFTGALRMWGTFECFSSIQLRITPTRNFAVFFPVIYLSVFGYIQLSGLATTYLTYFYNWHYMHYLAVGLLLVVIILSQWLLRPYYLRPPLPLLGIDWLGAILWSVVLLLFAFAFNYGEYYDWFDSPYIRLALVCAALFLFLSLHACGTYVTPISNPRPSSTGILVRWCSSSSPSIACRLPRRCCKELLREASSTTIRSMPSRSTCPVCWVL